MRREERIVTWLELVVTPHEDGKEAIFRLHPVGKKDAEPDEQCYAVSLDGRWLCSSNGRLTVLQGLATAEHFMRLIKMPAYETGEPADFEINGAHCISMNHDRTLGNSGERANSLH